MVPSRLHRPLATLSYRLLLRPRFSTMSESSAVHDPRRPKKLICTRHTCFKEQENKANSINPPKPVAPGDIQATADLKITSSETADPSEPSSSSQKPPPPPVAAAAEDEAQAGVSPTHNESSTTTKKTTPFSRAHQFITNPPLTISQLHPSNPLHQFHSWFRDPRLPPSSAPETCSLATALMPEGRVSARAVYLKELDERGWVVYSNWGSREGKGGQVFGGGHGGHVPCGDGDVVPGAIPRDGEEGITKDDDDNDNSLLHGNKWAALTFSWAIVERQVRIEGLVEPLTREESEMYWRTRERDSQIGAWASWQSKVLWSAEPDELLENQNRRRNFSGGDSDSADPTSTTATPSSSSPSCPETESADAAEEPDVEDGRAVLEQRVEQVKARFAGVEEIPLPPFWGGMRLVPESVEFWQGRRSRLHDRFRYVRVHQREKGGGGGGGGGEMYRWRIQRLSP